MSDTDRLSLREATMSLREATVVLKESYQDQRDCDAAMSQRMRLVKELADLTREVSTLEYQREQEKTTLKRYREEQGMLKKKLRRCRVVVEKTVDSIDDIFAEAEAHAQSGGQGDEADKEQTMRRIRRKAEEAEAEANALLATLDGAAPEERALASSPERPQGSQGKEQPRSSHQGSAVNCLDVSGTASPPPRRHSTRRWSFKSFQ